MIILNCGVQESKLGICTMCHTHGRGAIIVPRRSHARTVRPR